MSGVLWYICLALIGLIAAIYAICKKGNVTTFIAYYLFAIDITFIGEFFVFALFKSYVYKPGLFTNPSADAIVGHITLNTTLWPGTAILIAAYSLRYRWLFLITAFYVLAEYVFIKLGIYEHNWWKLYMSFIITFAFCAIVKTWFYKLNQNLHRYHRCLTFYFAGTAIIHLPIILLLLLGKQHYHLGWVADMYMDSAIFGFIYHSVLGIIAVFFICILNKNWLWKLTPILIFSLSHSILVKMNILIFEKGWNLVYLIIANSISLVIYILLEKYALRTPIKSY